MHKTRLFSLLVISLFIHCRAWTQTFALFDNGLKEEYPSVVYDFLERYLYEIDSLSKAGEPVVQRMLDDKVSIVEGNLAAVYSITPHTAFRIIA